MICANCHTKVHTNLIKIDKLYPSTKGLLLHYWDESGKEYFK